MRRSQKNPGLLYSHRLLEVYTLRGLSVAQHCGRESPCSRSEQSGQVESWPATLVQTV